MLPKTPFHHLLVNTYGPPSNDFSEALSTPCPPQLLGSACEAAIPKKAIGYYINSSCIAQLANC